MNQETVPTGVNMENQRISDRDDQSGIITSITGATAITGEIHGRGDLRLDGQMNGEIHLKGLLVIGKECRFSGRAEAEHIIIEGSAEGRIRALNKVEIRASARVRGKIVCQQIAIAEGAMLEGEVKSRKGVPVEPKYFSEKRKELQPGNGQG
jgi:cytoskeletal protein CcmA (bactofilin family)